MYRKAKEKYSLSSKLSANKASFTQKRVLNSSSFIARNESFTSCINQSLIAESTHHTVQSYGSVLPVLVIEAISCENVSLNSVSVKISESGWIWLVCARRVFVWKYKSSTNNRTSSCVCYELQLPPSDLSHKADLICLLINSSAHIPGLIAVSPEGIVRYWPSIAYDGHSIETTVTDLQGQECYSLTNIQPLGCILGTTTTSLAHISINSTDTGNMIICHTLKVPQGIFSGISKKVSSFIFGSLPISHSSESRPLTKILRDVPNEDDEIFVYVLAGSLLQKWLIFNNFSETLVFEYDLDRSLRDAFLQNGVWNCETTHPNQLQIWQIDIELRQTNELFLLVAGLNSEVSSQLYYALIVIDTSTINSNTVQGSSHFKSFICLRNNPIYYTPEDEEKLVNLKILNVPNKQIVYIYSPQQVLCLQYDNDVFDIITFPGNEESILGAGVCDEMAILFTSKDGLVSLISDQDFSLLEASQSMSIENEVIKDNDDLLSVLTKAFSLFTKKETIKSQSIVSDYILKNIEESAVDETVIQLSLRICDEIPNNDPRWAETCNTPINMTAVSNLISNQLEEKLKTHQLLIEFLINMNIWEKLNIAIVNGVNICTQMLLYEHSEKLIIAISLKKLQEDYPEIFDSVINAILLKRGSIIPNRLTISDIFYKEITKITEIYTSLIEFEEEEISNSLSSSKQVLNIILSVCSIIITTIQDACRFRQYGGNLYETIVKRFSEYDLASFSDANLIRSALFKQFELLVDYGLNSKHSSKSLSAEESIQTKNSVYQKIVDLVDIILDRYVNQLKYLEPGSERYLAVENNFKTDRAKFMEPLVAGKQYERAISLAEKYEDFSTLIKICEELDNKERLQRYVVDYSDKGFSEYLFNWYMKEGKVGKMLATTSSELGSFLKGYKNIEWIHQIGINKFDDASKTLKELALNEESNDRKRTLFSLSKLCALADGGQETSEIDAFVEDIQLHEMVLEDMKNSESMQS
ncbi:nuclear pore complex protein Nup133-like protein [Dinothrombium tinctorium]|uniref:Nuclear pore complex protein Nup133-like protein n=1 Tax=Dinothrombium tinctorium TaxID=1965070 RepID=A0A443RQ76_9ACAR|nr:nuclear pore complex protein Nup133-like protein [Dinothrombium tinctorium]RWS17463.1 nuclear pore complex protein Nup133-like protein [Dinothrombium tinctorium]